MRQPTRIWIVRSAPLAAVLGKVTKGDSVLELRNEQGLPLWAAGRS